MQKGLTLQKPMYKNDSHTRKIKQLNMYNILMCLSRHGMSGEGAGSFCFVLPLEYLYYRTQSPIYIHSPLSVSSITV